MKSIIEQSHTYFHDLNEALKAVPAGDIQACSTLIEQAFQNGKQIFVAGNGGSAATASHMACDFAKTTLGKAQTLPTKRMRAIALSDNVPAITAWGNDVSYDRVFSEQLRNLAGPGDLLIVITCSGNSPNIVECLQAAKELGVQTVGLLGFSGGKCLALCDASIVVRSEDYGVIEDAHSVFNHLLTQHLKQHVQS